MTSLRTALVGVTAASLLSLPVGATGLSPTTGGSTGSHVAAGDAPRSTVTAATSSRRGTSIRFLGFDRTRPWGARIHVAGQVVSRIGGQRGALRGVRVTLYRQVDGQSRWVELGRRGTGRTDRPRFRFTVKAKSNADYRVVYRGNSRFAPSRNIAGVSVNRIFNSKLRDGSGRFSGRVQPDYRRGLVVLEKRGCGSCGWRKVRSDRAGSKGGWSFKVGAPRSGRWWWRATTPASKRYIRSYSPVYTTRLR